MDKSNGWLVYEEDFDFFYKEEKINAKFEKAGFSLIEANFDKSVNNATFDFAAQMSVLIEAAQGLYFFED